MPAKRFEIAEFIGPGSKYEPFPFRIWDNVSMQRIACCADAEKAFIVCSALNEWVEQSATKAAIARVEIKTIAAPRESTTPDWLETSPACHQDAQAKFTYRKDV